MEAEPQNDHLRVALFSAAYLLYMLRTVSLLRTSGRAERISKMGRVSRPELNEPFESQFTPLFNMQISRSRFHYVLLFIYAA